MTTGPENLPLPSSQQQSSSSQESLPFLPPPPTADKTTPHTRHNIVTAQIVSMIVEALRTLRPQDIPLPSTDGNNVGLAAIFADDTEQYTKNDFLECPTLMAHYIQSTSTGTTTQGTEFLTALGAQLIIALMLEKVKKLPHLGADPSLKDLTDFASAVGNLAASLRLLKNETDTRLSNPTLLADVTTKMPNMLRLVWLMEVRGQAAAATLTQLADFLKGVAHAIPLSGVVDPVWSARTPRQEQVHARSEKSTQTILRLITCNKCGQSHTNLKCSNCVVRHLMKTQKCSDMCRNNNPNRLNLCRYCAEIKRYF